jgi:hypothetical protein
MIDMAKIALRFRSDLAALIETNRRRSLGYVEDLRSSDALSDRT